MVGASPARRISQPPAGSRPAVEALNSPCIRGAVSFRWYEQSAKTRMGARRRTPLGLRLETEHTPKIRKIRPPPFALRGGHLPAQWCTSCVSVTLDGARCRISLLGTFTVGPDSTRTPLRPRVRARRAPESAPHAVPPPTSHWGTCARARRWPSARWPAAPRAAH